MGGHALGRGGGGARRIALLALVSVAALLAFASASSAATIMGNVTVSDAGAGGTVPDTPISIWTWLDPWVEGGAGSAIVNAGSTDDPATTEIDESQPWYEIAGLADPAGGSYTMSVWLDPTTGYLPPAYITVSSFSSGTAVVDFALTRGSSISGVVQDGSASNLADICVWASAYDPNNEATWGNGYYGWAQTDASGAFTVPGLSAGTFTVTFSDCSASPRGLVSLDVGSVVVAGSGSDTPMGTVEMGTGTRITGTVTVADAGSGGTLPSGLYVYAYAEPWVTGGWGMAEVQPDGSYSILALGDPVPSSSTYILEIYPDPSSGYLAQTLTVPYTAFASDAATKDIELAKGAGLSGHVYQSDGTTPLSGACVWVTAYDPDVPETWSYGYSGWVQTEPDGSYAVTGLYPSDDPAVPDNPATTGVVEGYHAYTITVYDCAGGGPPTTVTDVEVVDALSRRDITMSAGKTISGTLTVSDAATGGTVPTGFSIWTYADPWVDGGWGQTTVNPDGTYSITGLVDPQGSDYLLFVYPQGDSGYLPQSVRVSSSDFPADDPATPENENDTATKDIELSRGGSIIGVVKDGAGTDLEEICVWVSGNDGTADGPAVSDGYYGWAQTDSGGNFTVPGLSAGTFNAYFYDCSPSRNGQYSMAQVSDIRVVAGQPKVLAAAVVMPEASRITGRVFRDTGIENDGATPDVDESREYLSDVCVSAQPAVYDPDNFSYGWALTTPDDGATTDYDEAGRFSAGGLQKGKYDVFFYPCGTTANIIGSSLTGASAVNITADGQTKSVGDIELGPGGSISGKVTNGTGGPGLAGVCVYAQRSVYDWSGGSWGYAQTVADDPVTPENEAGTYTIPGLGNTSDTDKFILDFYPCDGDALSAAGDTGAVIRRIRNVDVARGADTKVGDAALIAAGAISGTVQGPTGNRGNVCVTAMLDGDTSQAGAWGSAVTNDPDGTYKITGLLGGENYLVRFDDCGGWTGNDGYLASEWFDNAISQQAATKVAVPEGATRAGVNAALAPYGTLTGTATNATTGKPVEGVCVAVFDLSVFDVNTSAPSDAVGQAVTGSDGTYTVYNLMPGDYKVWFVPCSDGSSDREETFTTKTIAGGESAVVDAALSAKSGLCSVLFFVGGDCDNPKGYTSDPIRCDLPDGVGSFEVESPTTDATAVVRDGFCKDTATVTVDQDEASNTGNPSESGNTFEPLSPHITVTVSDAGVPDSGGNWDPPLEIVLPVPAEAADLADSEIVAYFDTEAAGTAWTPIPYIGARAQPITLNAGEADGYFVTGSGANREVHILTRHATTFSIFDSSEEPTPRDAGSGDSDDTPAVITRPPTTTKAKQSVRGVPARLKKRKTFTLPAKSDKGLALTWKSRSTAICSVKKVTVGKGKKKKITWSLRTRKAGTCVLVATNTGSSTLLPAAIIQKIKVR